LRVFFQARRLLQLLALAESQAHYNSDSGPGNGTDIRPVIQ
jgi:hypothetical protein